MVTNLSEWLKLLVQHFHLYLEFDQQSTKHKAQTMTSTTSISKDNHNHNHNDNGEHRYRYTCISCLQPSPRLYRQYSSAHNIKLQQCTNCAINVDVDTYIEYELLLVCMDLMLYRKRAYRHLLFNRSYCDYYYYNGDGGGDVSGADKEGEKIQNNRHEQQNTFFAFICTTSTKSTSTRTAQNGKDGKDKKDEYKLSSNVVIYILMIVVLKTVMKFQGLAVQVPVGEDESSHNYIYNQNYSSHNTCYYYYPMDKIIFSTASTRMLRILSSSSLTSSLQLPIPVSESEHYCYTFLPIFTVLGILSLAEYAILYFGTLGCTQFAARRIGQLQQQHQQQQQQTQLQPPSSSLPSINIARDIYLAIFLPQLFHIVTLLVHIYESSSTVQFIGSAFTCSIMCMAVHCVVERIDVRLTTTKICSTTSTAPATATKNTNIASKTDRFILSLSRIIPGWPLLFGLFLKFVIPQLLFMFLIPLAGNDGGGGNNNRH